MGVTLKEKAHADAARVSGSARPAVSIQHLSKSFRLPHQQYHTLKERVAASVSRSSFDVLQSRQGRQRRDRAGEFFGIVGRNGSGKSTLLKCLAGIYDIDSGEISVRGGCRRSSSSGSASTLS